MSKMKNLMGANALLEGVCALGMEFKDKQIVIPSQVDEFMSLWNTLHPQPNFEDYKVYYKMTTDGELVVEFSEAIKMYLDMAKEDCERIGYEDGL